MALNIYVTLENKESRHFQLVPEKFNWNNLVTILDLSQVSNQESLLVLYYRHPKKDQIGSVSNQSELDAVIDDLKTPYDALYFDINSDPTQPLVALSPFERLAQFVTDHQPLGHRLSRSVGLLASHIASSSQTNFDTEFEWLNQMASKRDRKLQKKELTEDSSLESEESDGSCKRSRRGRSEHFGKHRKHFGDGLFEHFEGPFGKHGKHFGGPFGKHGKHFDGSFGKHGKHFGGPFGRHFEDSFGKHDEHFGPNEEHFGGPFGKHGRHFGGPFGKHGRHFGGPFGKHGRHFGGPFGKHRRHFGGPFGPEEYPERPFGKHSGRDRFGGKHSGSSRHFDNSDELEAFFILPVE